MKFDYSGAKPLDGSPMMSANCWETIKSAAQRRMASQKQVSILEWGAGNSTVSLVRQGLALKSDLHLVSVEHETNFFHFLPESILAEFLSAEGSDPITVAWHPLQGPFIRLSKLTSLLRRHTKLEPASIDLQILLGTKRLAYIEGIEPRFKASTLALARNYMKLTLLRLAYLSWILQGIVRSLFHQDASNARYRFEKSTFSRSGNEIQKNDFFTFFEKHPTPGRLTVVKGTTTVELYHLPVTTSLFWSGGTVLEGSIKQLADYVDVPLDAQFDIIFIDGRARVSCIKRVHADKLLAQGGTLFVHDGFRPDMLAAFRLFTPIPTFVSGSNVTLHGGRRVSDTMGMPLMNMGASLDTLEQRVTQELFVFQNEHENKL